VAIVVACDDETLPRINDLAPLCKSNEPGVTAFDTINQSEHRHGLVSLLATFLPYGVFTRAPSVEPEGTTLRHGVAVILSLHGVEG
jgi:hypothetical protein